MLNLTPLSNIPLIRQGDNLAEIIVGALRANTIQLEDDDILVLAQKIVSKAEGRMVNLATIEPSERALELAGPTKKDPRVIELILRESNEILRMRPGAIIVEHKLGFVCANAGIDHSNVRGESGNPEDWVLLLPENPDRSAEQIRTKIESVTNVKISVLIIDSHGRAWREGTVGAAIGISGLPGLLDLRGQPDMFGFRLRITQVGVADELAAAASLMMGQAAEGTPVVHVRGFPYPLRNGKLIELLRPKEQDLFR
ncbi:MAG: coenzyme F420-0:L-glutamate ligase [Anaerolineales bacterium]|jgi:coenzyme F420-0:L-glutamate ligase/coenzyme F420-1:gamma-L-glutamate ligase